METIENPQAAAGRMKRILDVVEKAGNKVPHLAMIFQFPMGVVFARKHDKNADVGTIEAPMIPDGFGLFTVWTLLFVAWFLLGIPWGLN